MLVIMMMIHKIKFHEIQSNKRKEILSIYFVTSNVLTKVFLFLDF